MRLLQLPHDRSTAGFDIRLVNFPRAADIPPYAILSHTWGDGEVTFKDFQAGTHKHREGYKKLGFCANQATVDGLRYFWVDTCCIDKSNSSELSEAINSMFRWYQNAACCYVYLEDVSAPTCDAHPMIWQTAFRTARWFQRGWTLQELLLAPKKVMFFSAEGTEGLFLGTKFRLSLLHLISDITGIPKAALEGSQPLSSFSIEERMFWMEGRKTTKPEDMAYSLLGIFDTTMPLVYGEGKRKAFIRLVEEIMKDEERRKREQEDEDEEDDQGD
jgi:hypothetical protein